MSMAQPSARVPLRTAFSPQPSLVCPRGSHAWRRRADARCRELQYEVLGQLLAGRTRRRVHLRRGRAALEKGGRNGRKLDWPLGRNNDVYIDSVRLWSTPRPSAAI